MGGLTGRTDDMWRQQIVGASCAAIFLLTFFALAPHLVHHLFEPDHHAASCPFLALSHQAPMQPEPPSLSPPLSVAVVVSDDVVAWPVALPLSARRSRAPPQPVRFA